MLYPIKHKRTKTMLTDQQIQEQYKTTIGNAIERFTSSDSTNKYKEAWEHLKCYDSDGVLYVGSDDFYNTRITQQDIDEYATIHGQDPKRLTYQIKRICHLGHLQETFHDLMQEDAFGSFTTLSDYSQGLKILDDAAQELGFKGYKDIPDDYLSALDKGQDKHVSSFIMKLKVFEDMGQARGPYEDQYKLGVWTGKGYSHEKGSLPKADGYVTENIERLENFVEDIKRKSLFHCAYAFSYVSNGIPVKDFKGTAQKVFKRYEEILSEQQSLVTSWPKGAAHYTPTEISKDYNSAVSSGQCPAPFVDKIKAGVMALGA